MSNKDKVIYGIDLGTTYSCLAYVDADGKASIIKDKRTGGATVPSSVLKEGGDTVVGRTAKNQSMSKADKYADLFKRHMGEADEKDPSKPFQYNLDGKAYSPQALSAAVLTKLVNNANEVLSGHQLISCDNMRAVITYPAYFNDSQRNATEEAAKIAGLDLVDIIEEPLAAANYYVNTSNVSAPRNILVYDLGGGTFDITLVKYLENGKLEKLCVDGNARLGGADWDKKLIDFFVRQISEENGVSQEELRQDIKFMQDLSNKAEALKIELTETEEGSITVMSRHIKNDMMSQDISISRNKFEELTKSLLESTVSLIDHMYTEHAALNLPQPDEILFVGGSTKMPQVTSRLREKYPRLPILSPDPDEAVAKGAAIYAQKLLETATEKPGLGESGSTTRYQLGEGGIIQKASRSYGVKCYNSSGKLVINNVIIAHKTLTSELAIETYATSVDFQKTAEVKIYESTASEEYIDLEDPRAALIVEGDLPLSGNELKGSPITVQFDMSFGNMLKVKGEDKKTGKIVELECVLKGSISDEEIKRERESLAKGFQNK